MTSSEDFVNYLHECCHAWEKGTIKALREAPGREPNPGSLRRSKWYRSLSESDQTAVREIVQLTTLDAIFGLLVELDGDGGIPGSVNEGVLELKYRRGEHELTLSGEGAGDSLHSLFWQFFEPLLSK